jgi:hypothetical protein
MVDNEYPDAWVEIKDRMRQSPHPCGSSAFCHMVRTVIRDWDVQNARFPMFFKDKSFPETESWRFLSAFKSYGWNRPLSYVEGLLGKVTKATNKKTAIAISLAWPLWRDGPKEPADIEDIQTIMFWIEMFRGCSLTRGTSYWHSYYICRIRDYLANLI